MTQHECTVYKCDYCRKKYLVKHACARHEKYCPKNPNNQHICSSCPHLIKTKEEVDIDSYHRISVTAFFCEKLKKDMHSYVAERIGHISVGDTERMPLQCHAHPDTEELAARVAARLNGVEYKPNWWDSPF